MPVAPALLTTNSSSGVNTVTTATVNLAANALHIVTVVLTVAAGDPVTGETITVTNTVSGRTWTALITPVAYGSRRMIGAFRSLGPAVSGCTISATYSGASQTAQEMSIIVTEHPGVATTGTNGADAIGAVAAPVTGTGTTIAPTVSGTPAAGDAIFIFGAAEDTGAMTLESSLTSLAQLSTANARRHANAYDATDPLDTTPTFTIVNGGFAGWAAILKASSSGTSHTRTISRVKSTHTG